MENIRNVNTFLGRINNNNNKNQYHGIWDKSSNFFLLTGNFKEFAGDQSKMWKKTIKF